MAKFALFAIMAMLACVAANAGVEAQTDHHEHGHTDHDHGDHGHAAHTDHDHAAHTDHDHAAHTDHDHAHADHANHAHGQAAHDHSDHAHAAHDHSDHAHAAHDHSDHGHSCKTSEKIPEAVEAQSSETATRDALLSVAAISCASLFSIPILPLLSSKSNLAVGMSFAAGSLIADVFLHVLPHEMMNKCASGHSHDHAHDHDHGHSHNLDDIWGETREGLLLILGFMLFMLLAKLIHALTGEDQHGHSHGDKPADGGTATGLGSGAVVLLIADASHNFTDGLAVGAAFLVSPSRGFTTALAVFFHELPHEVGDIAVLIGEGMDKWRAVRIQFMTAGGAVLGCLLGLLSGNLWSDAGSVIGLLSAGGFIYVAMVTVVPQLMQGGFVQTLKEVVAMCAGVGMMVLILLVE